MPRDTFVEPDKDPRTYAPLYGDERATLTGFLRSQRETLVLKCDGLDAADLARRSIEPSSLSLLGLVRHLADVERTWFRQVMAGQEVSQLFGSSAQPDAAFDGALPDPAIVEEAWEAWRTEVAFADQFIADAPDLEHCGNESYRGAISLRWVLVHMVEEYARHNGHVDLLRERIDGAVGQ
ncbi:DinB family protein [Amycolatopsis nigrescens]|uniref:DinB family protein n=1 Tax=Amycolatopsis nigrescens TaxID=381445 RepID=UPI00039A715F|nr:DinB family protein [Amycolatopsis nigrescens]